MKLADDFVPRDRQLRGAILGGLPVVAGDGAQIMDQLLIFRGVERWSIVGHESPARAQE